MKHVKLSIAVTVLLLTMSISNVVAGNAIMAVNGSTSPLSSYSSSNYNFGSVTIPFTPLTCSVTIANMAAATAPLTISFANFNAPFTIATQNAVAGNIYTISPGQSRVFTISFQSNQGGSYIYAWKISHNASNIPTIPFTFNISATATSATVLMLINTGGSLQNTVDFGSVNGNSQRRKTVTFTNAETSAATLTLSWTQPSGDIEFSIDGPSSLQLAPGQSMNVTIRYNSSTIKAAQAVWKITHNASNQPSALSIILKGSRWI